MFIRTKEIRECAVSAYKSGKYTQQQVADFFNIARSTLVKWLACEARGEGQTPKKRGCRPRILNPDDMSKICALIEENPSITLAQLAERIGKTTSTSVIFRAVKELGFTRKKKLYMRMNKKEQMLQRPEGSGL